MKRRTPALTAEAIATAAGRKTAKVQRQLLAAQAELQVASAALIDAMRAGASPQVLQSALAHNIAAEEKVNAAAEDLEAVKELLSEAEPRFIRSERRSPRSHKAPAAGNSGEGARSLIPHLRKNVG